MMESKIIKNKGGDIPITILVIGVFAVCAFAIISFIVSDNKIHRDFYGTDVIEEINSNIEKYYFYQNIGEFSEEEIEKILKIEEDSSGRYLNITTKDISVEYYLPG